MSDVGLPQRGWLRHALNIVGVGASLWSYIDQFARGHLAGWFFAVALLATIAWIVLIFIPRSRVVVAISCIIVMAIAGGLASSVTNGVSIIPVLVAILWFSRDLRFSVLTAAVLALAAMLATLGGNLFQSATTLGLLSMEAGLVVAFLGGYSRRQFMIADQQARELASEQTRTDALAARQKLAGDIHDVLAHSLGGLVIQLDAVDALLEAGKTDAAAARVRDARTLAADGLSEARRAVAALRDAPAQPTSRVSGDQVVSSIVTLLDAHRSLDGQVSFSEVGTRHDTSGELALALRRAVQEGLTNARRHAAGELVTVRLEWRDGEVGATVSNPLPAAASGIGADGHGLVGMRARFADLPGGFVTAEPESGAFVVRVQGSTGD